MKNYYVLICMILLMSCSKKGIIYLNVQEPSSVHISNEITKLCLLNRTTPTDKNKTLDDIEKILTAEGVNLDKEGAEESIQSLKHELASNQRYTEVKYLDKAQYKTPGSGIFPTPLSWDIVEKICKENQTDALISLEFFDTNSKINYSTSPTTINTPLGNIPSINHDATMTTTVHTGWRFYDIKNKKIIDENNNSTYLNFQSRGANPLAAAQALLNRKEAVKQVANNAGKNYAQRILPYWIRVNRQYYIKGNDNLKTAKRKAQAGNWDGAAEIWKKESENSNPKVAGRATYNYAVIHEINGDLDQAIKWAQKAYEDFNVKIALSYIKILQGRKQRSQRLL